ncbi:MAG: aminoacyl-tRNA hydrolase [Syntrophorhabdaceae bacterium]|nr:aminoacyl-tRNA hydrolase [Syntrophorhabdaceae bacterium]
MLCGLGNKGSEYALTRHNMGYLTIDRFAEKYRIKLDKSICGCRIGRGDIFFVAKPETYMNISGLPVSKLIEKMGIKLDGLVVIHDDLDMEFGKIRIKFNGGDGGHRGVRSIAEALNSKEFYRLKIGIGRDPSIEPEKYVLSRFKIEEMEGLKESLDRAADALHMFIYEGKEKAMSIYNRP